MSKKASRKSPKMPPLSKTVENLPSVSSLLKKLYQKIQVSLLNGFRFIFVQTSKNSRANFKQLTT